MDNIIKVLQYGALTATYGGIESYIYNQYKQIDKNKISYDFIVPSNSPELAYEDKLVLMGSTIYRQYESLGGKPFSYQITHFLHRYISLYRFLKTHSDYDVVILNLLNLTSIELIVIAKMVGIPTRIVHAHQAMDQNKSSLLKKTMEHINLVLLPHFATHLFACSNMAGKWMFRKHWNSIKSYVINNGIDSKSFAYNSKIREQMRRELGLENCFVLGHCGRMSVPKNQSFIIDIFEEVYKQRREARLLLIGDGVDFEKIKKKVLNRGLNDVVLFLGERTNISDLLQAMDVFVFPSEWEGLGISLIEAQASGLKCFTSKDVIPHEVAVTSLVEFISLSEPAKKWAENIQKAIPYKREDKTECLIKSGFDVTTSVKVVEGILGNSIL